MEEGGHPLHGGATSEREGVFVGHLELARRAAAIALVDGRIAREDFLELAALEAANLGVGQGLAVVLENVAGPANDR